MSRTETANALVTTPVKAALRARGARRLIALLGLAAAILGAGACAKDKNEHVEAPFAIDKDAVRMQAGVKSPVRFDTEPATAGPPIAPPPVTARVATVETLTAPSFAPLEGRVAEVRVRIGDHVKQGDKLVLVRTADLASLEHDLAAANLAIKTKQSVVERLQRLMETRAASQSDLLVAQSELAEARLGAQTAAAKIRSLSVARAGDTAYWVLATRAGTVVQMDAPPGAQVGPNRDRPIATVADLDEVLVLGDLAQKDAALIAAGDAARIAIPGATAAPIEGKVEAVAEVVDPDRQTVPIRVRVDNKSRALRPNAYVDMSFETQRASSVVQIPSVAVVSDGASSVVFVEAEPGLLRRREVLLGRQGRDKVEIASGLTPGERVVTTGALLLLNALDVEG